VNIFRELYRQYWIRNIENWDSRTKSLGTYCNYDLSMKYSLNNGKTWTKFQPDAHRHEIHVTSEISDDFSDYISKDDWIEIKSLFKKSFIPSMASVFLTQAFATCDKGDLKKSFIETVTALEIALECTIKKNPKITKTIIDSIQSFESLPLRAQFGIIALLYNNINSKDIENSIKAIEIRNNIVHEGYSPKESERFFLNSLLVSISRIINEQVTKFPSINSGNCLMSIDSWEKLKNKKTKPNSGYI